MNNDSSEFMVRLKDVRRSYTIGKNVLAVLKGVNRQFRRGSFSCIVGASGSGKTTLLNLMGALEKPDSGEITVNGTDLQSLSRRGAALFRARTIGFVFQAYHLFPELNILENVILPGSLAGRHTKEIRTRALELLERVGLKDRLKHRPNELSGGEQQRAAIARALINDPPILLADEPTGNLDEETGRGILTLFDELRAASPDRTIIMITHNREIAASAQDVAELKEGVLQ